MHQYEVLYALVLRSKKYAYQVGAASRGEGGSQFIGFLK